MDNHIKDKVIIVTGAAAGFGHLVCLKAAAMGAKIVAADINELALRDTIDAINSIAGNANGANPNGANPNGANPNGAIAIGVPTDVTDAEMMHDLANAAIDKFGQIDVMLNNAGVMPLAFHADHKIAAKAWDKCIDINFKGVVNGISAVHDQMITQGRGHVINIASIYGNFPVAGGGVYGATKAAVVFLSESLRVESQGKIKVTIVRPTGVPGTNLGAGIINPLAISGLLGGNMASFMPKFEASLAGQLPQEMTDKNHIEYFSLDPDSLADQIIYTINQPWGVSISDITVRASGDEYII